MTSGGLAYPKKSHRKEITIPAFSAPLAEFVGILLGDGGLNNSWQATISLNAISDRKYSNYVCSLGASLFKVIPAVRKRKTRQTLVVSFASTSMVEFLISIGIPFGNKLAGTLLIPTWIYENSKYRVACVRGLMDTDGCLFIHRHKVRGIYYENIGLCFTSYSPELVLQVALIFQEHHIKPHVTDKGRRIYLYSKKAVQDYLKIFGTSNERISELYKKWNTRDVSNGALI